MVELGHGLSCVPLGRQNMIVGDEETVSDQESRAEPVAMVAGDLDAADRLGSLDAAAQIIYRPEIADPEDALVAVGVIFVRLDHRLAELEFKVVSLEIRFVLVGELCLEVAQHLGELLALLDLDVASLRPGRGLFLFQIRHGILLETGAFRFSMKSRPVSSPLPPLCEEQSGTLPS